MTLVADRPDVGGWKWPQGCGRDYAIFHNRLPEIGGSSHGYKELDSH
jgi:hypothetical protein